MTSEGFLCARTLLGQKVEMFFIGHAFNEGSLVVNTWKAEVEEVLTAEAWQGWDVLHAFEERLLRIRVPR